MARLRKHWLVPAWTLSLLWFVAGVGATGAVWYFLSIRSYRSALAVGIGTCFCLWLAIGLHRRNDRLKQFRSDSKVWLAYACLLTKSAEHEYPVDESHDPVRSSDPWVMHRDVRSELMLLLGELEDWQARVLLTDWLAKKPWEERIEVAMTIVRRTPPLDLTAAQRKEAAIRTLARLASIGMNNLSAQSKAQIAAPQGTERPNYEPTLSLLRHVVTAGSDRRRDAIVDAWAKEQSVVRSDM